MIRKCKKDVSIFGKLFNILKINKPDIVQTNELMTSFYASIICKLLKIKFINGAIRDCIPSKGLFSIIEHNVIKLADVNLANSKAGLKSRKLKINSKNNFIYNGFDVSRINRINTNNNNDIPVVGMVASFSDLKDYDTFFRAAIILIKKGTNIKFATVGDGKNIEKYKELTKEFEKYFVFYGKRYDVEKIVNEFDICILTTFSEGLSNSIMEYMALGKPVIATDCEGNRELVLDGITGYLIEKQNPLALVEKIEYLIDNKTEATELGKNGRERILNEFNSQIMINKMLELYNEIVL